MKTTSAAPFETAIFPECTLEFIRITRAKVGEMIDFLIL
jgi:hypothetical protein